MSEIVIGVIAVVGIVGIAIYFNGKLKRQKEELKIQTDENTNLKINIQNEAQKSFECWKQRELGSLIQSYNSQVENAGKNYNIQLEQSKLQIEANLRAKFLTDLEEWKQKEEETIRKDAITRSQSVIRGHMTEQLAPYMPEFNMNPKDARFIGSPLDFIVFDGLSEGELKRIVIVEVKSGNSQVNQRERQVKNIIKNGLIEYREMRIQLDKDENQKQ